MRGRASLTQRCHVRTSCSSPEPSAGSAARFDQTVPPYVLVTPAHNEEAFIDKTIQSMINQRIRPLKWIVVNDSSTDRTGEIVEQYAAHHDFIRLVNLRRSGDRHFGNKVRAFNRGLTEAQALDYRYIGNLDADISLEKDYFEKILRELDRDPNLGLAGGMVSTCMGDTFVSQEVALDSVAGAVQLFRRECFEQIGGYLALPQGGIDAAAEIMARMKGWKVRTFPELRVLEHRRTGTATSRPLVSRVKEGQRFQSLGYGFLFLFLRCVYRSMDRPRVVGSAATLYGYLKGLIKGNPIVLPPDVVLYLRAEQRSKLMRFLGHSRRVQIDE
jgi:glycosyltransferase involved in cell wall biosynthesis